MKKNISTTVTRTEPAVDSRTAPPSAVADGATSFTQRYHAVVGLDVGDRQSHYCVLDGPDPIQWTVSLC